MLTIIYNLLKENILLPLIYNFDIIMKNKYLNTLIKFEFENNIYVFPYLKKIKYLTGKINIFVSLKIPKIIFAFDGLVNYVNYELFPRYMKIEGELNKFTSDNEISKKINNYNIQIKILENNLKNEINKYELLKKLYEGNDNNLKKLITKDYLYYFVSKYFKEEKLNCNNYNNGDKLLNSLKLILQLKLREKGNFYEFKYSVDELAKIILFTTVYNRDIKGILIIFLEFSNYCENIHERIINILDEKLSKHENIFQIVNKHFYLLTEAFIRSVLLFSLEFNKMDKIKFKNFIDFLYKADLLFQNLNRKFSLKSKELINMEIILNIINSYQGVNDVQFESNYKKIINLINQINSLDKNKNVKYIDTILDLIKIINDIFNDKNDKYINLIIFIIKKYFINLNNEELKIYFLKELIKNELIIKGIKIFLSSILKDFKPKIKSTLESGVILLRNFLNIENKHPKLIEFINNINKLKSFILNEVLLYLFECQCQSYFLGILNKYKNEYSKNCCEKLLLNLSLSYLRKAIEFLDCENSNNNNLLKLNAISYIKTYCYFYVEINLNYFDFCDLNEINEVFDSYYAKKKSTRNMRILYFWRVYYKKFENFEKFKHYNFGLKNISFYQELKEKLDSDEENKKIISNQNLYKQLIMGNYDPSIYNQNDYPDIQYYTVSDIGSLEKFNRVFRSYCERDQKKYVLINSLLNQDLINDIKKLNCLNSINNLTNILLKKYNSKISRENAKKILFRDEIKEITYFYNYTISENYLQISQFEKYFVKPFFDSWEIIKTESVRYKCIDLYLGKAENPLDMNKNLTLNYFLVDDGEIDGGIFLASAYEKMINLQNNFINLIISKNEIDGPLNKYISQLEQVIDIQDASSDEIITIDDNIFEMFKRIILESSTRNIFTKDNKIDYKNYNDIIYDLDYIEEKLGELLLLGKKKLVKKFISLNIHLKNLLVIIVLI